jgi:anthranilate synthase component 1
MQFVPSLSDMQKLTDQGNLCPLYTEISADLETPVSAYLKTAQGPWSFLLESVEGGQHLARYSFIGTTPYMTLRLHEGKAHAIQGGYKQTIAYDDPLEVIASYLADYRPVRLPDLPRFVGGAVGYLSYEAVCNFERIPRPSHGDYDMPDGQWQFVDTLLVFDHVRHRIKVISHVHLDAADLGAEYGRVSQRIAAIVARLRQPLPANMALQEGGDVPAVAVSSNVSLGEYVERVMHAKEYIAAGDIFQVVPSQRFQRPVTTDPFTVYRSLRTVNPSPYMFYITSPDGILVGASPELLVRVEEGQVTTHPIAGTVPRGKTAEEDEALAHQLLNDEKEKAEHLMLVDLGRNDIGRVAKAGSVRVPRFMQVEKFSHVQHLVSHVTGELRDDMRAIDALRACFPAGTVSGAPKIRAMEIIAELEGSRRGVYAGAVGHIGFNGDLDTCIALRTIVIVDGVAYVQAGGGVVADSDPEMEYRESCNKAAAPLRALELADRLTTTGGGE